MITAGNPALDSLGGSDDSLGGSERRALVELLVAAAAAASGARSAPDPTTRERRSLVPLPSGVTVPTFDAVDTLRSDLDGRVRRCHRYGCATPVGLMLERSRVVLGADVPEEIIGALVPGPIVAADRRLDRHRPWLRLHEDDTLARWLSRSARDSVGATLGAMPSRSWRTAKRHLRPPEVNESDDDEEKARFLAAVVTAAAEG